MHYDLTYRGQPIATFNINDMDPDAALELRSLKHFKHFTVKQSVPDRLAPLPTSNLDDVVRAKQEPVGQYLCGRFR